MAELPSRADLGERDPRAARPVPQYPQEAHVANALQRLGAVGQNLVSRAMSEAKAKTDQEQAFGVHSRFLEWDNQWQQTAAERARAAPSGAAGFADSLRPDYNKSAQEFLKTVPADLQAEYANKITSSSLRIKNAATAFETEERDRHAQVTATKNDDLVVDRVNADPDSYEEALADSERNWRTSGLPAAVVDKNIAAARERLIETLFNKRLETNRNEHEKLGIGSGSGGGGGSGSYVDRVAGVESGNNPRAKNPRSTATGLGQVIESTWTAFMRDRHPELMKGDYQSLRNDPALSREAIQWYADQNAAGLRSAGLPVRDGTLYLAHFAGPGGARSILSADPNTPIEQVLTPGQIRANPFLRGKTAGDVIAWADRKMGTGGAGGGGGGGGDVGVNAPAPEYASLPLEKRQALYNSSLKAMAAERTAQNVASLEARNRIDLLMERGEPVTREQIMGAGLNPEDEVYLLNQMDAASKSEMDRVYDQLALKVETGTTTVDEILQSPAIDDGKKATLVRRWQERNALGTYDLASQDFSQISNDKIDAVLAQSKPEPGSPGYSVKRADYARIEKAAREVKELRRNDPASAADGVQPEVIAELQDAVSRNAPGSKRQLAEKRLVLQELIGIGEMARQPLTAEEAADLAAVLTLHENDPRAMKVAVERLFKELDADYGPLADEVASQVLRSKGVDRTASAIGAALMRKMGLGIMPTPEDAARMDRALEQDNIAKAMNGEPVVKPRAEPPSLQQRTGRPNPMTPPAPPQKRSMPNAAQVELLRKNPNLAAQFDERFGQGAAKRFLTPENVIVARTLPDGSKEISYDDGWVEVIGTDGSISGYQIKPPKGGRPVQ